MAATTGNLALRGLGRRKITALAAKAKRLGMTAERYVTHLIDADLALDQEARTATLDELLAPVRAEFKKSGMSESDLEALVDAARSRHHRRVPAARRTS